MVGWGVWKQTYRREPRRGVALRVLEPVLVAGNCGARGCSGQGWGATELVGARRDLWGRDGNVPLAVELAMWRAWRVVLRTAW